ncbi:MAG: galactokinase [bacterium]|nr:galactokinase [bacterium]
MEQSSGFIKEKIILFKEIYGEQGNIDIFFSPGRVNLIGEHLDYNGGAVFPAAISLGIYAFVRYRDDRIVRMRSQTMPGEAEYDLKQDIVHDGTSGWWNYPAGVLKFLKEDGKELTGADIFFAGTLPNGAGLSSSASLELLTSYIMTHEQATEARDRVCLAELCQKAENQFVGVNCGIMDQFAIAMGKKDCAVLLYAHTLEYETVPLALGEYRLIIMNTNKPRTLAGSQFNERRRECERALASIRTVKNITRLVEAEENDVDSISDETIKKRARHVVSEHQRVLRSAAALKEKNLPLFGLNMTESHRSLKDDYEVSCPELDSLVSASLSVEGCIGARMTGAGFGGAAIALVRKDAAQSFIKEVGTQYTRETGLKADFYEAEIVNGVQKIGLFPVIS